MRNDKLKAIGLITMTIDHIGYLFFPNIHLLRIIGRIAFPIFAYQITVGFEKTSNVYKYMSRLFIFALLSQIPYMLVMQNKLNILFTLLIGLIMIHIRKTSKILSVLPLLLTYFIEIEYGIYGLLTICGFYIFEDIKPFFIGLNIVFFNPIQIFSTLALPIIEYEFKNPISLNKYVSYLYYPSHLLILYLLKFL